MQSNQKRRFKLNRIDELINKRHLIEKLIKVKTKPKQLKTNNQPHTSKSRRPLWDPNYSSCQTKLNVPKLISLTQIFIWTRLPKLLIEVISFNIKAPKWRKVSWSSPNHLGKHIIHSNTSYTQHRSYKKGQNSK